MLTFERIPPQGSFGPFFVVLKDGAAVDLCDTVEQALNSIWVQALMYRSEAGTLRYTKVD